MDSAGGFLVNNCRPGRRGMCVTVAVLAIIIGCILLAFAAFASSSDTPNNLQQVAIVFRHGDKNPTETYPTDPHADYPWPDGLGALTKKGMRQLYMLGKRLREMYQSFIGEKYQSVDLMVLSSNSDRCIMSAQALLAALYPPKEEELFISALAWRPIPVHSIPRNVDKLIAAKADCPRLEQELDQAFLNYSRIFNESMDSMYKELSANTGTKISSILDVEGLYNILEIEVINNLELPSWAHKFYNEESWKLAAKCLALFTSNTLQRRLRGGPLLKEILENMSMRRNGTDERKVHLYSAHDLTLVNLIRTMGFTEELIRPEYGAALIFELHTAVGEQDHEVKISYLNNTESTNPQTIHIPGCEAPCSLETLLKIWEPVLPDNWELECLT